MMSKNFLRKMKAGNIMKNRTMKRKWLAQLMAMVTVALMVGGNLQQARADASRGITLARDGRTPYVITLASDASDPEKNAASELASYLKQITGAEFKIKSPAQASGASIIAIGPGAASALMPTLALDKAKLGDDGIVMKTASSHLVLTGAKGSSRGTLYAVYTFLEDVCGVRWWTQSDSFIPAKPNLEIDSLDLTYVPDFRYREALYRIFIASTVADADKKLARIKFLVQSKYNGHFNGIPANWGGSYFLIGFCHTFDMLMPSSRYFAKHPEWYSEIAGKRVAHNSQLCCTNEAMIAELTKNILDAIAQRPNAGIISVTQNDNRGGCQCAKCMAMDKAEGSPSGSLLYCVNKVAEAVEKKYPGFMVETLAYQHTRKPPKTIRPRSNVIIRLAVIERSGVQPLDNPMNNKLMNDLQNWKAVAQNLFVWDYTADIAHPLTPHPNLSVFAPDTKTYAANNVIGVFFEGNHKAGNVRGDFDELKTYLMSHLLWNPRQNEKAIITDFLNGYYGKAGPMLQQYLDLIDAKSRKVWLSCWGYAGGEGDASWMNLETMNQGTKLFDLAEAAVSNDPVVLNRVKRARLQLDHQWLRRYNFYKQAATVENKPFLGPLKITSATESFILRVKEFEGSEGKGAINLPAQPIIKLTNLPTQFARLPRNRIVDIQEDNFIIVPSAVAIVPDPKASNGFAARMDPAVIVWGVQFGGVGKLVLPGKWHVYANVRYEKNKKAGIAFTGGIYDMSAAKNLSYLSVKNAKNSKYKLYDMGMHDLGNQCYVWFGTTGGVSSKTVKAIYIDRIIFIKEQK